MDIEELEIRKYGGIDVYFRKEDKPIKARNQSK